MDSTLLLFIVSPRVDPYINAIAYSFQQMQVRSVKLVHVSGALTALSNEEATILHGRIIQQLGSLAEGKYIDFPKSLEDPKNPQDGSLDHAQTEVKERALEGGQQIAIYGDMRRQLVGRDLTEIEYLDLKQRLRQITKADRGTSKFIIDLTGTSKALAIDIFATCLALGLNSVYAFELTNTVDNTKPEASLYHALSSKEYRYTSFSDSKAVKTSQRSLVRKGELALLVLMSASVVLLASIVALIVLGPDSTPLQIITIIASLASIASAAFTFAIEYRQG